MTPAPRSVTIYGLLGLIPFVAPPATMLIWPNRAAFAEHLLALYGALILSFLGGARWGLANARPTPSAGVITLSMLPSLIGLGLLLLPDEIRWVACVGLAIALALHWLWDVGTPALPPWYPWLRSTLTAGAVLGLLAGATLGPH